jgi:heme A synthase
VLASYLPLALSGAHLFLVVYLTYAVVVSLYASYKSLGPSQNTRGQIELRARTAPIFVALALASLLLATYSSAAYVILSYKVWAEERGVELPERYVQLCLFQKACH